MPLASRDFSLRMTGIGGTGILTLARIIATAATLEGRTVRGLDQTGLAQKGGPVVSDLRITDASVSVSNKLADEECDLYLGCDVLVASDPKYLHVASPSRTLSVVSTSVVPTGAMVSNTEVTFPEVGSLTRTIGNQSRGESVYLDAAGLSLRLFGDDQYSNVFLVGAAYQRGALPLQPASIEEAIRLNGNAVDTNIQAFRRGRQAVALGDDFGDLLRADGVGAPSRGAPRWHRLVKSDPGSSLETLVASRSDELRRYQNARYAAVFEHFVEHVRQREASVVATTVLTEAVANNLYKLMAYKDEYEVARLSVDPQFLADLEREFGEGAHAVHQLHPPVLRALGLKRKIGFGPWARPFFRALYALRFLRGTPFDAFGWARVRRVERALISDYRQTIERVLESLTPETLDLATQIARLPDLIRGYESIKLNNVTNYRMQLAQLEAKLASPPLSV